MRNNQPVTNAEYLIPDEMILVSRTDLRGTIIYCNKAFCEASGFSEAELLGQPHNIVRHPDMPQRTFADLWEKVAEKKVWHGVLKNRRKNGDYYWVDANISPYFEDGQHAGYLSLRYQASREQIAKAAKHYGSILQGKLLPLFTNKPDKDYVARLQQRLAEKIVAQENYLELHEQEQRVASGYLSKLITLNKLRDASVQFHLKPAANFSGDLIAIARTPDNRLHLLLADSTGHGLSAALAGMPMIHPFYSMTSKGFNIQAIAREMNRKVWEVLPVSHFVAAILVSIDTVSQMVEVWSGGCPPPVILDGRGECVYRFKPRHLAMGILSPDQFDASVEYYSYEDDRYSLLMYSDGVTDLKNADGEQFGLQRLLESAQEVNAEQRWQNILHAIADHADNSAGLNHDDIAIMSAQFKYHGLKPPRKESSPQPVHAIELGTSVWQFALTLDIEQIRKLDVVPLLLDIVQQIERDRERGGEIFMILSELFNNALDHGLLKLDSGLKHHEDGMEKYYEERASRLAGLKTGRIQLFMEKITAPTQKAVLRIRMKDSGKGFDYQAFAARSATPGQFHGRGILLLQSVCRSVHFLGNGSEVEIEFDLPEEAQSNKSSRSPGALIN